MWGEGGVRLGVGFTGLRVASQFNVGAYVITYNYCIVFFFWGGSLVELWYNGP